MCVCVCVCVEDVFREVKKAGEREDVGFQHEAEVYRGGSNLSRFYCRCVLSNFRARAA